MRIVFSPKTKQRQFGKFLQKNEICSIREYDDFAERDGGVERDDL